MSTIILRLAEKKPQPSTAVANGQFFIVRKSALDAVGGFQSVQNQILDDIEIARSLIKRWIPRSCHGRCRDRTHTYVSKLLRDS
jgi:hypothetical protein